MKFLIDAMEVCSHRFHAKAELIGDFLVEKTFGQQADDLLLARGQVAQVSLQAAEKAEEAPATSLRPYRKSKNQLRVFQQTQYQELTPAR